MGHGLSSVFLKVPVRVPIYLLVVSSLCVLSQVEQKGGQYNSVTALVGICKNTYRHTFWIKSRGVRDCLIILRTFYGFVFYTYWCWYKCSYQALGILTPHPPPCDADVTGVVIFPLLLVLVSSWFWYTEGYIKIARGYFVVLMRPSWRQGNIKLPMAVCLDLITLCVFFSALGSRNCHNCNRLPSDSKLNYNALIVFLPSPTLFWFCAGERWL